MRFFQKESRERFLVLNLLKGILWLLLIIAAVIAAGTMDVDYNRLLEPFYEYPLLVYSIFTLSEVIIGVIPPGIFMMWALKEAPLEEYVFILFILATISYIAGYIGYIFGRWFNGTALYAYLHKKYMERVEVYLHKYGMFLIIVAALTPVPFSASCMLVGAVRYSRKSFLLYALSRFLGFALHGWIVWEANQVVPVFS